MLRHLLEIAFYGLCIAQGLLGWLSFGIALHEDYEPLMQCGYRNPTIAPLRRLLLSAMSWALMFACVLAWWAPMWTVALTWAGVGFAAASFLMPAVMEGGLRGPPRVSHDVWVALLVRIGIATFLTWQAPRMG